MQQLQYDCRRLDRISVDLVVIRTSCSSSLPKSKLNKQVLLPTNRTPGQEIGSHV